MYYTDKRHETGGIPKADTYPLQEWRMRDRLKTVSAALAICLNIGVDPPDVVKTNPTAKLECWIDPMTPTTAAPKIMEQIGKKLQEQYESLSIRTRYKQYLDPSVEETKKFCISLRRNAKDERILFHYNGHGVPLPTPSGEMWVFNKNYTQYIPISLLTVQSWLISPCLYVFDCSHAGNIIHNFDRFIDQHEMENLEARLRDPNAQVQSYTDNILLAACGRTESLPTNPELPADLFTCCLTTPIEIALRFFVLQNPLPSSITLKDLKKVPGRLQERRTPLGELNWIFTAITDTIAWNLLPRASFKKLFRQDLMVAALFRNFLLSERIMRTHHCHPVSQPSLPETHNHPLWQSWDLAVEMVLAQLPAMLHSQEGGPHYEYQHSTFFSEQLTAFEVYLTQGAVGQKPPDQLPIVLQVLLSQVHRLRALILLSKFLDLGPWAVNLALSIGIFPYVLKLLQSAAQELKPVMVFIWARILAVDPTCQTDLLKDNGYQYFISILSPTSGILIANASEHRAMCAFIIAMFCEDFHQGQVVCLSPELLDGCLKHLEDENPLLRHWSCLCISMLWVDYNDAKWAGIRSKAYETLCRMALDPVPEVRAAMLHALTSFLGIPDLTDQIARAEEWIATSVMVMTSDASSMVRNELVVFFSTFVKRYENKFIVAAYEHILEEKENLQHPQPDNVLPRNTHGGLTAKQHPQDRQHHTSTHEILQGTLFASIWKHLFILTVDPHPEIAANADIVVDYVHNALLQSPLGTLAQPVIDDVVRLSRRPVPLNLSKAEAVPYHSEPTTSPTAQTGVKHQGYLSRGIKRTASVAVSLKNIAFGGQTNGDSRPASPQRNPPAKSSTNPNRLSGPPRTRTPAEWTRPPEDNDQTVAGTWYHQAKVPVSRGFKARNVKETPSLPLRSRFFEWSTEVNYNESKVSSYTGLTLRSTFGNLK
jgi:regulator-associated protein of mTOR